MVYIDTLATSGRDPMTVINTNMASMIAANALTMNERDMGRSMQRLSTGKRINSAKDDAAGLAISSKMTSQIRGTAQAVRNANDAIAMLQTADGAVIEIENILQRMRELTVQGTSGSYTTADTANLNLEFHALADEIERIADNTQWNSTNLLDNTSNSVTFQIGANASQTIGPVNFGNFQISGGTSGIYTTTLATALSTDTSASGSSTPGMVTTQSSTITAIDAAITAVASQRATYGAFMNRLDFAADNLLNISQNTTAARSRILDTDYARETAELARTSIIQHAAASMLSHANVQAATVLALLS